MVLAKLISQFLESNRRLVVPQIGAFLVKEPEHKVLFSTLVKRDDGVLRELLISNGSSAVEAESLIGRLVFELRYALENQQEYTLVGVGSFRGDENGVLNFTEWVDLEPIEVEEEPQPEVEIPQVEVSDSERVVESDDEPIVELEPIAESKPQLQPRSVQPKRKTFDVWLIVAIAAGALALGAILYGFVLESSQSDFEDDYDYRTLIDEDIN